MISLKKRYHELRKPFLWEASLSFANFTLLTGAFLIGFSLELGASNLEVGLISALPLFANLLQFFSAFILEWTGTKKWTTVLALGISRLLWIPIILIAFGLLGSSLQLLILVVIVSSLLTSIGNLALLSWTKDCVPTRRLSDFLGKKNNYAYAAGIVIFVIGAWMLDLYPGMITYGIIFATAILLGVVSTIFLLPLPERKRKITAIPFSKFKVKTMAAFRDEHFRPLLIFGLFWGFSVNITGPFYLVFMLDNLGLSFLIISGFYFLEALGRVIGPHLWIPITERYGAKPVLVITCTMTVLGPLSFVFMSMQYYWTIAIIYFFTAFVYSGVELGTSRALFKTAPRQNDAYYLAAFSAGVGVTSAIGPVFGGLVATLIQSEVAPIRFVFVFSFVARILSLPLIYKLHEPRARTVEDVLLRIKRLRYFSYFTDIYSFSNNAAKLVLIPQKQLFIIQRKTTIRLRTDVGNALQLIAKLRYSIGKLAENNRRYFLNRLPRLKKQLTEETKQLSYADGTLYQEIPEKALKTVAKLETQLDTKDVAKKAEQVEGQMKRYRKKLKGAYDRNIR